MLGIIISVMIMLDIAVFGIFVFVINRFLTIDAGLIPLILIVSFLI